MIRLDDRSLPAGLTPFGFETRTREAAPTLGQTIQSAFAIGNDVTNFIDFVNRPRYANDEDPNAWMDQLGFRDSIYELQYQDRFLDVRSANEARAVMSRIDQEERHRAILARSGTAGFLAGVAAGALSPTTLIPVGGWYGAIAKATRGAAAVRGAASAATGGLAAVAIQEAVLHTAQETRTLDESILNTVGAVLLSGILGGAAGAFSRREMAALGARLNTIPGTRAEEAAAFDNIAGLRPASAGAAAAAEARGTGELAGALGVERALRFQDPMLRLQTSQFTAARDVVRDLAETPLTLAENAHGIATSVGGAVETLAKQAQAPLATALRDLDRAFLDYWGGLGPFRRARSEVLGALGVTGGRLSYSQFKEAVFDAMLAGDVHTIPQVQRAATAMRQVFNQLRDDAIAANVPGFAEAVEAAAREGLDAGYVYRVYDTEAIRANRTSFVDTLTRHFIAKQSDLERRIAELELAGEKVDDGLRRSAEMSESEVRDIAEQTTDTILGHNPSRMMTPGDIVSGPRGPLKERTLRIPTALIREFVERDPEVLARMAARTMATDTAMVRKFGSTDLAEQLRKVNDEANAQIKAAKTEKERRAIDDARKATIRDIEGIRDRLRGNYALPANPEGLAVRASRVVRNLNYLRLLGGMTVSAFSDVGKPVFVHGLTRTLGTLFHPFVRGLSTFRLAAKEVKLSGTALDMVLDSRTMAIADVMDDYGRGSRFERGLSAATRKFGIVSLMAPWNAAMKQFAGIITQTRMLQAIERVVKGTASKKEVTYLAAGGIDAQMAERIWRQFAGEAASVKRLPSSASLSTPAPPTADDLARYGRVESVPLEQARGTQSQMQWERFEAGQHPPPLIEGYADKPVAVRREDGEYLIFDGHHRVVKAINRGDTTMDMHVIDAKKYAPEAAGIKPKAPQVSDEDLLRELGVDAAGPVVRPPEPKRASGQGVRDGNVWWANTESWADQKAVEAFRSFLVRDVDRTIVTPGQDKPLWMSNEVGKLIGQFKSFAVGSIQRTLLTGLQQRDMAALNGTLMMLALGALTYWTKQQIAGQPISDNPAKWATEALDYSGLMGWLMEANNIAENATGGRVGLSQLTGETATRYASRNQFGALLGPTFDLGGDVFSGLRAATTGEWTATDVHTMRKLIPLQNLFYIRQLFDAVEAGVGGAFGIPARSN